jgi:hypothetical protein
MMLHPVREWQDNVLSSGFFYGSVTEAAGFLALIPGYQLPSVWVLMLAPILVVIGIAVQVVSVYQYGRQRGQE